MNLERVISKCNAILRTELGFQDGGEYAWKWSEDLRRCQKIVDHDGNPVREIRAHQSGLLLMCDTYRIIPMFDHRVRLQWILAKRVMPDISESDWIDQFGSAIPYPKTGQFVPCAPVYLDHGVEPDEKITWGVVNSFRRQRQVKASELDEELRIQQERGDRNKRADIRDDVLECMPAFHGVPGTKEHYSFGGVKDVELAPSTKEGL